MCSISSKGGIFTLSPVDAATVLVGENLEDSFFPPGYISLVSDKFSYLLGLPGNLCMDSSAAYGDQYNGGILCKTELRALKIYTRGLLSGSAPPLRVEVWYNNGGVGGQFGGPDASQLVGFHQVGADYASRKQGYSLPVVPGRDHSYKISLTNGDLPDDWVIEFSDPVIGNRWSQDELYLRVAGRDCGNNGLITSQHDRKFIWGGNGYLDDNAWFNHGACAGSGNQPPDEPLIDCDNLIEEHMGSDFAGVIEATQCPGECPGGCDNANSYCDCGTKTCSCKAGFFGPNCGTDICADADCGEHGSCAARYLGGEMPVSDSDTKCICKGTWQGDKCDSNPCKELNLDCSGKGTCVALSDTQATCECEDGYFGPYCNVRSPCEGFCQAGSFPYFGCGPDIGNKAALGCFRSGGCYYLSEGQDYPYDGFCTYKTYGVNTIFNTEDDDIAPPPTPVEQPILPPSSPRCGCDSCTEDVWNTLADGYTCGGRISFLRDSDEVTLVNVGILDGPFDEAGACRFVSEEFPSICTCLCGDDDDEDNADPTSSPTLPPTQSPTAVPTSSPTSPMLCGCDRCTEDVWNIVVDGYSCGSRISFVRDSDNDTLISVGITDGPFDEAGACKFVSDEFPDTCTCFCGEEDDEDDTSDPTGSPTIPPTSLPTLLPTILPTDVPTNVPTDSPTAIPTTVPTESPTEVPTSTESCEDSPLEARIRNKDRDCGWIATSNRCSKKKFWRHCRASCDKCDRCMDSKLKVIATIDGNTQTIKCSTEVSENLEELCLDESIALSCPRTCGVCA